MLKGSLRLLENSGSSFEKKLIIFKILLHI